MPEPTAQASTPNASANNKDAQNTPAQGSNQASAGGTNTTNDSNRGLPYYEKLRRELRDTLQRKRLMDKSMSQLEDQIYRFEQSYLEETNAGNIIKGFDNYIKGSSSSSGAGGISGISLSLAGGTSTRRKAAVVDSERVFSRSSVGFGRESPTPPSTQSTPSHAPTPTGVNGRVNGDGTGGNSKNKKKAGGNKGDDEDDEDKPALKRVKITYGRD